jgi:hypothetical protein
MPDCLPCAFSVLSGAVSQSEGLLGFCLGALDTERYVDFKSWHLHMDTCILESGEFHIYGPD